jgi:hypothetical protein
MAVNPSSANGLTGCTPEQIGLDTSDPATCPTSSKVGSVRIDTPLLGNPLEGGVYLATQGSNPFRSLLALYLVAVEPETGVLVKLAGKVSPDPATGQLTTTFEDTPQVPFERLHLQLKGGPDAPLLLPSACGTYTARAAMASWAAPDETVVSEPSFTVDRNCAASARFSPGFEAGTADPTAGRFSPFLLRVTRGDGEAGLSRLAATLPEGLLARLAGVPLCPEAEAPTGACPPASRVGGVTVGVGAGPSPLFVPEPGRAPTALYLAGPYEGAPYSLVAVVPAQAGPFDLGTVVVRDALRVDPVSTRVTAESDPLPRILEGIPISYRDLRVEVDRPGFTRNPTSCGAAAVESTLTSTDGRTASPAARFATADCAALAFSPRLSLRLAGPTRRGRFPALTATLRMPAEGQAGLSRVQVTLPHSEFLEQAHIGTVCTRVQYAAHACPARSVYGHARAYTPLLDRPLEGPVYLRSSDHTLPDLVASLDGPIHVDLAARIDSRHQGIRTTFSSLPDAPVTRFVLQMQGGRKGLLVNSRDLCAAGTGRATVAIDAQNGRSHDSRPRPATGCGGRKGGK